MSRFLAFSLLLSLAVLGMAATLPLAGPHLESVPGPSYSTEGVPAVATWPMLRYDKPLRVLAIGAKTGTAAEWQRICRRMRATLDVRYLGGGDDRYHVNDKWIEPSDNPTAEELAKYGVKVVVDTLNPAGGTLPYDVIFCGNPNDILANPEVQQHLLAFVNNGGVLVVNGAVYPAVDSPLGKVWPGKPGAGNSWMHGGAQRTNVPELAGIPVERLSGHNWIPVTEATPGAAALSNGEAGAVFKRILGKGAIVFVPMGLISRTWDAVTQFGRGYDHDEIWLRLWDQLLYTIAHGEAAIPSYTDLRAGDKEALPGTDYKLPAKLVNRAWHGPVLLAVHVTTPHGTVVYAHEQTLTLAPGDEQTLDLRIPIAPEWPAGLYPVYLTVGDPATKRQFQQSLQYLPVSGLLQMELTSAKKGYQVGEEAQFTLSLSSRAPWSGKLLFGVYDFRGRLLAVREAPAQPGTGEKLTIPFSYRLLDDGVRADAFWAEVAASSDGKIYARAETKFYKYEPWSMRNEYQWSTWAGIACAAPSLLPPAMQLMAHAGMNALGYPGRNELFYPAERWGWRYYNEGIGMNTFAPVIEYENDAEIEQALRKEAQHAATADLTSAAFVLGSVGEEAGFKNGWGTRYYWDTPLAPEKACKALQWYLKDTYPNLAALNAVWNTGYKSWDEVKLTKEFSERVPSLEADGWAHPKASPLGAGSTGVSLAPYRDTADFYNWYYDRIVTIARRILREQINPVTQTMSSAPTIGSARYDVRQSGPSGWNESQLYSVNDNPEPGFGLIWGHFDWSVMTENMFWGFLLMRSGHNNYWVDVPLMFNNDLSHTRASFAMRRWTYRLAGHERIILDSKLQPSEVGVLGANGITPSDTPRNMTTSTEVALNQAGFGFTGADIDHLAPYKVVFAVGRQALSRAEAEKLHAYVTAGGTLVFTPRFASQTELGAPQPVSPGWDLAARWGLTVTGKTEPIPQYYDTSGLSFPLDGVDEALKGSILSGQKIYREQVKSAGWTQLAAYADHLPALLTRQLGKGRLIYLNAVYQSHWYIQWVTPTGAERQGFYRFIEWACAQAGARRLLRVDGNPEETLHMAVKLSTDPTGRIHYAIVRTNGEVPWSTGRLHWLGEETACYDVLGGEVGKPAPRYGRELSVNLRPGAGKLLAFVAQPLKSIRVTVIPAHPIVGQPLHLSAIILGEDGKAVPGAFPLELRVSTAGTDIAGLQRSFSLESGDGITLNTALNDPAGVWTLSLTDGISGLSGSTTVKVAPAPAAENAPGYIPWGWTSELQEPANLAAGEFLSRLHRLAALYRQDHAGDGWMTKQYLGYYYDYFPGTRHDLLRPLNEVDWPAYATAIRQAVRDGETFILTGEDVGVDPATGLATWPHHDGKQLEALTEALRGASWSLATPDGETIAATLGKGKVILCRESIDAAGNTNAEAAHWQTRWRDELAGEQALQRLPRTRCGKVAALVGRAGANQRGTANRHLVRRQPARGETGARPREASWRDLPARAAADGRRAVGGFRHQRQRERAGAFRHRLSRCDGRRVERSPVHPNPGHRRHHGALARCRHPLPRLAHRGKQRPFPRRQRLAPGPGPRHRERQSGADIERGAGGGAIAGAVIEFWTGLTGRTG